MINSRQKGKRGERLWRDQLREQGFTARRGQQYAGGIESPDVICEELSIFIKKLSSWKILILIRPVNKLQKILAARVGLSHTRKVTKTGK